MTASDSKRTGSRISRKKDELRALLGRHDTARLVKWSSGTRNSLRVLTSMLFETESLIRWRAIEAIGKATAEKTKTDIEEGRKLLRGLFWLMNDESGGLCWHAPEAIAEVMVNDPTLKKEFGAMLFSFLSEEPFESGVRWAILRFADTGVLSDYDRMFLTSKSDEIVQTLTHKKASVRGNSIRALTLLEVAIDPEVLEALSGDNATFTDYDFETGDEMAMTVGDAVALHRKSLG